jgi:mRNA interferase MazF
VVSDPLQPGVVALLDFGATVGREQSGTRPAVVISSESFHSVMTSTALVVPCTRTDRGWRNHVELAGPTGLSVRTFAITEQPRVVDLGRVLRLTGSVNQYTLDRITLWVREWIFAAA